MPRVQEAAALREFVEGDQVELIEPDERHGLRRGARGTVMATLRYWDRVRVDFGRGRQVAVSRDKLRHAA